MESLGNLVNALIAVQKIFILTPFARSTSRETTDKFFGPYLMAQVEESCEREIGETPIIKVYSFNASSSERYAIHLDFSECADSILNFDVLIRVFVTDSEGQGPTNTDADILTLSIMPEIRIKHTSLNEYIGDSFKNRYRLVFWRDSYCQKRRQNLVRIYEIIRIYRL